MGDALDRGNCRGLKLTVHVMKVIERIAYSLVRQVMTIQWGTLGGWEDLYADGIFIIANSMEEHIYRLLIWKKGMEKKGLSEHREDHNYDLLYRPWPTREIRQLPICHLPHWCRQQH